ncbi:MAG: MarR family transcriptional regulator [Pseudomonadota bacterium]|nr:MarR family transcriptional regulator [Pseudomonadota bacterium]
MPKPRPKSPHLASLPRDRRSARALDLRAFVPAALTLLAHKISASASAAYRPRFGVGVTDWRLMALLAAEPWIVPVRIAESTGLDKAAVSRALRNLRAAGLVEASAEPSRRRGVFALTTRGLALHDELAEAARERQRQLLHGFTAAERELLQQFVDRMLIAAARM